MKNKEITAISAANTDTGHIRVACYIRVSTLEQANEGYSIGVQTEKLQAYCVARGWDIVGTYTDPGFSGSNMDRPALSRMLADVKSGHIDMVLVYKIDRLSRSQRDTLYMIEDMFLKNDVDFVSMTENFDTSTPLGRAMIGILSVFAQLEREQIKERMAMGNVARAASGLWRGGSGAPTGYDYVNGQLIVNDYEAMQIRLIFELFLKGYTFHGIAVELRSRGYTNKYGSWKNPPIISQILTNTTYIGKIHYAGEEYDGQHEPIIDMDTWEAVQIRHKEVMRGLSEHQKSPFKAKKLLTGIIWCGDCGARYFYHCSTRRKPSGDKVTYDHYLCYTRASHKTMRRAAKCGGKTWKHDDLNNLVISEIKKLAFSDTAITDIIEAKRGGYKESDREAAIKVRLSELDKQLNKIMDLYALGNIPLEVISEKADTIQKEREALSAELESLKPSEPVLSIDKTKQLVSMADSIFTDGTMEEQRALVNALISKIVLQANGDVDIYWKFV